MIDKRVRGTGEGTALKRIYLMPELGGVGKGNEGWRERRGVHTHSRFTAAVMISKLLANAIYV